LHRRGERLAKHQDAPCRFVPYASTKLLTVGDHVASEPEGFAIVFGIYEPRCYPATARPQVRVECDQTCSMYQPVLPLMGAMRREESARRVEEFVDHVHELLPS
jgi:hypothetical protein